MKKLFLLLFSLIFTVSFGTGCTVETASQHDAQVESEAESIRNLQEDNNTNQTTNAAASALSETVTVYLSVDCSEVIGKENLSTSAEIGDGLWLTSKAIIVPVGSSVYDVIYYAKAAGYVIDYTENNSITNGYIASINNLYQKECGKWSGWMYMVNGVTPGVGSKNKIVSNGDNLLWFYTTSES